MFKKFFTTKEDAIAATIKQSADAMASIKESNSDMLAAKKQGIAKITASQIRVIEQSNEWDYDPSDKAVEEFLNGK